MRIQMLLASIEIGIEEETGTGATGGPFTKIEDWKG